MLPIRTLLFYFALAALALLLFIGVEILSRYIHPSSPYNRTVHYFPEDPDLGWMNISLPDADPSKFRIMVLGGSNTSSRTVGSYVETFEDKMMQCSSNIQVINLGVEGYGTAQEYMMWTRYKKKI